jgi:hypothetical protein
MKELEIRYVAHITTLTDSVKEWIQTDSTTLRELICELDHRYSGFKEVFINPDSGALQMNSMIYYSNEGQPPVAVVDLGHPIQDKAIVTFW